MEGDMCHSESWLNYSYTCAGDSGLFRVLIYGTRIYLQHTVLDAQANVTVDTGDDKNDDNEISIFLYTIAKIYAWKTNSMNNT